MKLQAFIDKETNVIKLPCETIRKYYKYQYSDLTQSTLVTKGTENNYDYYEDIQQFYGIISKSLKKTSRFVESIVFNGNSCIDTGIPFQNCTVETLIKFEDTGSRQLMGFSSSSGYWWGAETNGRINSIPNTNAFEINTVSIQWTINETASTFDRTITVNDTYTITAKGLSLASPSTCKIGALSLNGKDYPLYGNVYYSKIYNANGELLQDLRPFVDEKENAFFFDLVTKNRFYNTGTGTLGYTEK